MKILIVEGDAGSLILTTDSPASLNGVPVLRRMVEGSFLAEYIPADDVKDEETGFIYCKAALIVAEWGSQEERTPNERTAAAWYCRQWPEGPQVGNYENWSAPKSVLLGGKVSPGKGDIPR